MINDVTFVMKRHKVYSPQLKLKMILKTIQNKVLIPITEFDIKTCVDEHKNASHRARRVVRQVN